MASSVCILEMNPDGHRLLYVAALARECLRRGYHLRIATVTGAESGVQWQVHFPSNDPGIAVLQFEGGRFRVLDQVLGLNEYIVIPDGDGWLVPLLLLRVRRGAPVSGSILLMRPKPQGGPSGLVRYLSKRALVGTLRLLNRDLFIGNLVPIHHGHSDKVLDPVKLLPAQGSRDEWLVRHGLSPSRRWLAILGDISERKYVEEVAHAICSPRNSSLWSLVLVGKLASSLREQIHKLSLLYPTRIVLRDGYHTDSEFDSWVQFADALSILQRNEGSSGVLLKAWVAGKPVLVGGSRTVIDAAHQLGVGSKTIERISISTVAAALEEIPSSDSSVSVPGVDAIALREADFLTKLLPVQL